jgi:hypothetical protein
MKILLMKNSSSNFAQKLAAITFFLAINCISIGFPQVGKAWEIPQFFTKKPSNQDLIQAVRSYVNGKTRTETQTYTEQVTEMQPERHSCTQTQVDADPHATSNPELAKCPHFGATYEKLVPVNVPETRTRTVIQKCETLSEYGWNVQKLDNDTWRVSHSRGVWDVNKVKGI